MPSKFFKWLVLGMVALFATLAAPAGGNGGSGQSDDENDLDTEKVDLAGLPDPVRRLIEKLQTSLREVNAESKERRLALQREREEASRREQERLAQAGQYQQLAETRAKEIESLKPYQTRAQQLEEMIAEGNQRRIGQIPEGMRTLIPQLPAEQLASWLDANWRLLTTPTAPNTDAGAGSTGGKSAPKLTPDQKAMADAMGVSHENYAKQLAALQMERGRNED